MDEIFKIILNSTIVLYGAASPYFYGLNPCIFEIGIMGCFWRLFVWREAHIGWFSAGPLGLDENPFSSFI